MLKKLDDMPEGVIGLEAIGTLTKEDYDRAFEPILDEARREGQRVRMLFQLGPEFDKFSAGAAWEDARFGVGALRLMAGCAVVTDVGWVRQSVQFAGMLLPCPLRVFANEDRSEAAAWLASLPAGGKLEHRMVSDLGVLVVEPKGPLSVTDFEQLALVVDPWIAAHDGLNGLVIHVGKFPGWDNLGSFIRHVQFIRNHHHKLRRVALAADTKLADFIPQLTDHFVAAEVKHFGYDEVDAAIAWAGEQQVGSGS